VLRQDCMQLAERGWAILTLKSRNRGMHAALAHYKPVVFNLFAEGSQIQIYHFVRVALKKFNASQFTRFVLLQNEVCYTKY